MALHLQILFGRERGSAYALAPGEYVAGRAAECELALPSDLVSRSHMRLTVGAAALRVEDLGSSNGTFVNGARVLGEGVVVPSDVLMVGDVAMRLHDGDLPELSEMAPGGGGAPDAPTSVGLAGSLVEIPPSTVLRYLAVIKKTGVLVLTSPQTQGRIALARRHISEVFVSLKKSRDPVQALTAILRWRGTFAIEPPSEVSSSTLLLGLDTVIPPVGSGSRSGPAL